MGGRGGVDVEMGGLPLFLLLFSQNAFALCLGGEGGGSKVCFITF